MIDLHLHSNCSDGTQTPAEMVKMAAELGLRAVSITDHDTAEGAGESIEAGRKYGIDVISGIELSVNWGDFKLHLLGYDFDWLNSDLTRALKKIQNARSDRNRKILEKLSKLGIKISADRLAELSGNGQAGRPHIAQLMVENGVVKNIDQAFAHYLKDNGCAYVPRYVLALEEAILLIHNSGGIAVLAHPVQLGYSLESFPDLLDKLRRVGLDGVETYYPSQKGKIQKKLSELARRFDLLETGGSDYHGEIRPGTTMAVTNKFRVPFELFEHLVRKNRYKQNYKKL